MSRSHTLAAIAATALFASLLSAQTPAVPKIAVVNLSIALTATKDGKQATLDLDQKFEPQQKEVQARESEVSRITDQLQKSGTLLSDDARSQLEHDLADKQKKLDRNKQDAQESVAKEEQKLVETLGQKLLVFIKKYAKDNGYTLVLDVGNPNTPVLYNETTYDVTADLVSSYDKASATAALAPARHGNLISLASPNVKFVDR
ncbi:MAG: OmpH family outer membrane protein [Bryobacteraceae bacterium]